MVKIGKFLLRVSTAGISTLFALLLLEIILRIYFPQPLYTFEKGLFVSDPRVIYRLAKNKRASHSQPEYSYTIETNSWGFRGPEPHLEARFKVLLTGDSFGFGQGVAESGTFAQIARNYFKKRKIDVDILNTSVHGYAPVNELAILKETIPRYQPDLVLHFFYWNDIPARKSHRVLNGYLVSPQITQFSYFRAFLNQNSNLFVLIKKILYTFKRAPLKNNDQRAYSLGNMTFAADQLRILKNITQKSGSEIFVFIIPVDGIGSSAPSWLKTKNRFFSLMEDRQIPYADLSSHLSGMTQSEKKSLAFRFDTHWNSNGHRFFSRPIIRRIQSELKIENAGSVILRQSLAKKKN